MTADTTADPRQGGHRRALAIATGRYRSPALPDLDSPARDVELMRRVLGDERLGGFESVSVLCDADLVRTRDAVYDFFTTAEPDDFLLAYFSGHGLKDVGNELFLATIETDPDRLLPSAIPAYYVADCLNKCRARRVVVVLDCCYAGAFLNNLRPRGDIDRMVIVSASSVQLAHEGTDGPSVFGHAFFNGIETGAADFDGNGWISVREAFDHAAERLRDREQSPRMDARVTGDLWLARAPAQAGVLPDDLASLVASDRPALRLAAVDDLTAWLASDDAAQVATAERTLTELRADPDEQVAFKARRALARRNLVAAIAPQEGPSRDARWYQRAVFYEVRVRSYADADGDGVGDLRGLTGRLDYLQWLGVDCLLLSSIFDSPLLDDGYDVSDFTTIHPELGDLSDFVELIDAAHRRGIGIVLDLVLDRTSDRHRWYQESREDYYLRGDVLDLSASAARDGMLEVIRFWLDLGADGYRLSTGPHHDYLKSVRAEMDRLYPGRILLAGARTAEARAYFGDDQCHMVLNAGLMPRLLLAVRTESHHPVSEMLANAPEIPDGCQWVLFLRNGDELVLDGVTEEEREFLLRAYAPAAAARTARGIRRRLAPLADNDRTLLELSTALLFSLPGSPCVYYGDEIGMGDNLALPGRHSLRTPMQWSPDRNAGFSQGPPDRLMLPVLMDPVYGYQAANVEAQRQSRSLLRFVRRMIEVRRHSAALAHGVLQLVGTDNPAVLAFIRSHGHERMLCVLNFSRYPQAVRLDLAARLGDTPVELLGGARFLPIDTAAYPLAIGGHGFYWLALT